MQSLDDIRVKSVKDTIDDDVDVGVVPIEEKLRLEVLEDLIMNFKSNSIKEYDKMVNALHIRGS